MKWLSVQPYRWNEKDIADQLQKCSELEQAGVNHIAFSSSLEPDDPKDLYRKAHVMAEQFRKTRERFQGNLKVGILIQSTLSHGWKTVSIDGFQQVITVAGVNNRRFCPLNSNFRNYIRETIKIIAAAKPDFLLVDDDFRMVLSGHGCFCPEHLKRFAEETGKEYTREELQEILMKTDPESVAIGRHYTRMSMDTLQEVAKVIRESIDSVNPDLECGFCTSSEGEYAFADETARILAGKNTPFVRLNNGFYIEDGAMSFVFRQMNTAIQIHYINRNGPIQTISECDTYPHHRYSLSLTGLNMHICSSLLSGTTGMKMWIENYSVNNPRKVQKFKEFILANGKKFQKLSGLTQNYNWYGPTVPLPADPPQFYNPPQSGKLIKVGDFIADSFGFLGIAAKYEHDDGKSVVLLSGGFIEHYSDSQLKELLKRKCIIDSEGVKQILKRGFGGLIGVKEATPVPLCAGEYPEPKLKTPFMPPVLNLLRANAIGIVPVDDVEVLSWLKNSPYPGCPVEKRKKVAPGAILYKNELGGTVISLCYPMTRETWNRFNNLVSTDKKDYFARLLEILDPENPPVYVGEDQSCYLMYLEHKEKPEFLAAAFNLSLDPLYEVSMKLNKDVKEISVLQPDGTFKPVEFRKEGDFTVVPNPGNEIPIIFRGTFR